MATLRRVFPTPSAQPVAGYIAGGWSRAILAGLVIVLVAASFAALAWGYAATASVVTVTVDGMPATVRTHSLTVGDLLAEMEVVLRPEDRVTPSLETRLRRPILQSGGTAEQPLIVTVQRSRPLLLDGAVRYTLATTLGQALAEAAVAVGPNDELTLAGQPATVDTPLPAVAWIAAGRPGVRPVYPWRGLEPQAVEVKVRRAVPLELADEGPPITLWTTATTVGEALAAEGLTFYEGDLVRPGLGTPISAGLHVSVQRSKPVVIQTKGTQLATRTRADTVAHFLMEQGIAVVGLDRVEPALDSALVDNTVVIITRVQHAYEIQEDVTPFETVWLPDPEMEIDNSRLDQEGVSGITRRRYLVVLEDGEPITRTLQDTWLAQEPITRTYRYGTQIVLRELETSEGPVTYWRKVRMYATSYSPATAGVSPDKPYYGRSRLGLPVKRGVVAVDPSVVRLRTRVYVPGYGSAIAADTGGGVLGRWIDLGFADDEYEAWHRCVDVYLLGTPPPAYQINYRLPNYPKALCLRR